MKNILIVIAFAFILFSCNKDESYENGTIKGKVIIDSELELNDYVPYMVPVWLEGTSLFAYTDSSGDYYFLNIPEGSYNLKAQGFYNYYEGKINNVEVKGAKVTNAPDIILSTPYNNNSQYSYINYLRISDEFGNIYNFSSYYETLIQSQNIIITGYAMGYNGYLDTIVSIQVNEDQISSTNSQKGYFSFSLELTDKLNQIKVFVGPDEEDGSVKKTSLIYLEEINYVKIELEWYSGNYDSSAGDFDIHLINNTTNDSCWYNNYNPDWGIEDLSFDDPYLNDNTNQYGNYHGSEYLEVGSLPDGTYSLNVHYFSNHLNNEVTITPTVRIQLGENYFDYTNPQMEIGDFWAVATFTVPFSNKSIEPTIINKTIQLSSDKFPVKK